MIFESEQVCIGALITGDPEKQEPVWQTCRMEYFGSESLRQVFEQAKNLRDQGQPVDLTTLAGRMGGGQWTVELQDLTEIAFSVSQITVHAKIVKTEWVRDQLVLAAGEIRGIAEHDKDEGDGSGLIGKSAAVIDRLQSDDDPSGFISAFDGARQALTALLDAHERGGGMTGLATGMAELDNLTGGLQDGDLFLLGGRPSHGKTAVAMAIAHYVAKTEPVLVFSAEMAVRQLIQRSLAMYSQIELGRIRSAEIADPHHDPSLQRALVEHRNRKLWIDDTSAPTISSIRLRAKAQARKTGCRLIVVDYLQLLRSDTRTENRVNMVTEISQGMKSMAREMNCPVIALAQLSRDVEKRPAHDRRPVSSDLRDSGSIEQDADVITFVYQDDKYNEDSHMAGIVELIIRKQRQGPLGTVYCDFDGSTQTVTQRVAPLPEKPKDGKSRGATKLVSNF